MVTLTFFNDGGDSPGHSEGDWEVSLVGDEGEWTVVVQGPKKSDKWECGWDHKMSEIIVVGFNADGDGLSPRLVMAAQTFLRSHIKQVYTKTQGTLDFTGSEGCGQCGQIADRNQQEVTWRCTTCWGLTCRNCCLTVKGSSSQYYEDTYCSELCLACATPIREWEAKQQDNGPFAFREKNT